jgi:hypothetical protein
MLQYQRCFFKSIEFFLKKLVYAIVVDGKKNWKSYHLTDRCTNPQLNPRVTLDSIKASLRVN